MGQTLIKNQNRRQGLALRAAFGEAAVSNTIAPVKESIQVTGPKEITLTYDATIVASDINSTNGKSQYTVKIGNTVETIVSISILSSSKSVKFVTTNSMTAASEVKLAYWANGTDANQKPKSSTGSGVAAAFGEAAVSNTIAPVKESIQVTGPKEITLTYDATIVASDINSTNGKSQYTVKIGNTVETIVSISILSSSKSVKFVTTNSMTAASEVKLAYWANGDRR